MKHPKLFATVIARNEAHNIQRCFDSIVDIMDRIIMVDTGSTDDTVKIAREYGAIVYPSGMMDWRVSPRWNFSYPRNQAFQYAEELGADWAFVIDMDESLRPMSEKPSRFKDKLAFIQPKVHALATQVHENENGEFTLSFWGTRFFRMNTGCHYEGTCHNRPKLVGGYSVITDIVLYHHGYHDPKVMQQKRDRTMKLLDIRIRDNPDTDYEAYYYKCMTLAGMDNVDEAIKYGEKCVELVGPIVDNDPNRLSYFGSLYYAIGWCYFRKWQFGGEQIDADRAYQWWQKGWEFWPDDIDLNFELTVIGHLGKRSDMVFDHGQRYLDAMEKLKMEYELELQFQNFSGAIDHNGMVLGRRHIHHGTTRHETLVRKMMQEMMV